MRNWLIKLLGGTTRAIECEETSRLLRQISSLESDLSDANFRITRLLEGAGNIEVWKNGYGAGVDARRESVKNELITLLVADLNRDHREKVERFKKLLS